MMTCKRCMISKDNWQFGAQGFSCFTDKRWCNKCRIVGADAKPTTSVNTDTKLRKARNDQLREFFS